MAKTRSTKATPAHSKASKETESSSSKITLPPQSENPSQIFILPSKATPDARIVTLPNPRHLRPSRYLVCPETGIYEFTKAAAPKTTPRSWLIETSTRSPEADQEPSANPIENQANVFAGQELYIATAIDPLFLSLPALADVKSAKDATKQKRMFLSSDDHFEKLPEGPSHLSEIMRWPKTRALIERRMGAICDTVEAGDEIMFRLSEEKLLSVILDKATKMSEGGLPPSMEEKFVKKTLEAPILIQKRVMSQGEVVTPNGDSQVSTPQTESTESQSTVASTTTTISSNSQPSTAATSFTEEPTTTDNIVSAMEASPEVIKLQRLKVAFNFICSNYLAPTLVSQLQESLTRAGATRINFSPLDEYLSKLSKLRAEALAARSVGDYTRKHSRDEEDDEARAEKKRKMEEEKKRKASESRGVRELKKVNTKGMKKMSDFFKKKV